MRLTLVLIVLAVCCSGAFAGNSKIGSREAPVMLIPTQHIPGIKITYSVIDSVDSIWQVQDFDGTKRYAKGIYVHDTATAGYITVHLIESDSGCGSGNCLPRRWRWLTLRGNAGDWRNIIFDAIKKRSSADSLARHDFDILM